MTERLWSPSQILRYRECPRKWDALRGPGAVRPETDGKPPESYRVSGMAIHAGVAAAYREASSASGHQGGKVMSLFAEHALGALDAEWAANYPVFGDPEWIEENPQRAQDLRQAHNLAASDLVMTLDRLPVPQPGAVLAIEQRVVIEAESGFREVVIPDLMLRTGASSLHVRDWKRTKVHKLPRAAELMRHDQLGPYAVAARQLFPWVTKVTVGLYSTTSRREILAEMPREAAEHVVATHEAIADAAEHAAHYPAYRGQGCWECPARPGCPAWANAEEEEGDDGVV